MSAKRKGDPSKVSIDTLSDAEIAALEARHAADPDSLSDSETLVIIELSFRRTRSKLRELERRASEPGGSDDAA